jgi:hypothetical protein
MDIKQLIQILKEKENKEVQFIICDTKNNIVAMNVQGLATDLKKALSIFKTKDQPMPCVQCNKKSFDGEYVGDDEGEREEWYCSDCAEGV